MAYRSSRHEKESVGVRALELVHDLRSEFVANFARRINSAHEAECRIDQFADDAGCFELAHSIEWEDAVDVALGVASGIAEVPNAEFVAARVERDAPIRRVLPMKARLIAIHDSARTHQRDFAFADRFCERSEWRRIVLDPSIRDEVVVEIAGARNICDGHAPNSTIEVLHSANSGEQSGSAIHGTDPYFTYMLDAQPVFLDEWVRQSVQGPLGAQGDVGPQGTPRRYRTHRSYGTCRIHG
jgi:hypothetical protein